MSEKSIALIAFNDAGGSFIETVKKYETWNNYSGCGSSIDAAAQNLEKKFSLLWNEAASPDTKAVLINGLGETLAKLSDCALHAISSNPIYAQNEALEKLSAVFFSHAAGKFEKSLVSEIEDISEKISAEAEKEKKSTKQNLYSDAIIKLADTTSEIVAKLNFPL